MANNRLVKIDGLMKSRGFKLTRLRRRVFERLLAVKGHVSADELFDLLRKDTEGVSRATVYRTLSIVSQSGLVQSHDFDGGRRVYEPMVGRPPHDHFFCIACGKVIEFEEQSIESLQKAVAARHRFTPVNYSRKIVGYCETCAPVCSGERL